MFFLLIFKNKIQFMPSLHSGCVAREVILQKHPVLRWKEQCSCSMWVNVSDCTKINCTQRLKMVHHKCIKCPESFFSTTLVELAKVGVCFKGKFLKRRCSQIGQVSTLSIADHVAYLQQTSCLTSFIFTSANHLDCFQRRRLMWFICNDGNVFLLFRKILISD